MPQLDPDQIGALTFFAFAAVIALQAWLAKRSEDARRTLWPRIDGAIVDSRPIKDVGPDDITWMLALDVAAGAEVLSPAPLLAQSDEELARIANAHPAGAAITLRRDPKSGVHFVEGHLPRESWGQLAFVAVMLFALGIASLSGALRALLSGMGGYEG